MSNSLVEQFLADKVEEDALVPDDVKLESVRDTAEQLRKLQQEIAAKTVELEELQKTAHVIQTDTLPKMMSVLRMTDFGLTDGHRVEIIKQYYANIAADWDEQRRTEAFTWLRNNGLGDLIKNEFKVPLAKGQDELATALREFLQTKGLIFTAKEAVAFQTLTATVRGLLEEGKEVPMSTLGAFVQDVAKFSPPKTAKKSKKRGEQ